MLLEQPFCKDRDGSPDIQEGRLMGYADAAAVKKTFRKKQAGLLKVLF